MKTKLSILLLLIAGFCLAQSNQFIYEYTFKIDSLNRAKSEIENMVLQTSPKGSKFYSQVKAVYDSTMTAAFKDAQATQKTHFDFTNLKQSKVSTEVIKTYPDYKSDEVKHNTKEKTIILQGNVVLKTKNISLGNAERVTIDEKNNTVTIYNPKDFKILYAKTVSKTDGSNKNIIVYNTKDESIIFQ